MPPLPPGPPRALSPGAQGKVHALTTPASQYPGHTACGQVVQAGWLVQPVGPRWPSQAKLGGRRWPRCQHCAQAWRGATTPKLQGQQALPARTTPPPAEQLPLPTTGGTP